MMLVLGIVPTRTLRYLCSFDLNVFIVYNSTMNTLGSILKIVVVVGRHAGLFWKKIEFHYVNTLHLQNKSIADSFQSQMLV